jgi:hypothetical protein
LGYILVPVPTEYVLDIMRWVLFRAADGDHELVGRDVEQLQQFIGGTDDATRALLQAVAEATARGEVLQLQELADGLEREPTAVREAIDKLNAEVLDDGRDLFELRTEAAVGVHGRTGRLVIVSMRPLLVRAVRSVMRQPADG